MFDTKKMKAIGMMLARNATRTAEADGTAANEVIDLAPILRVWKEGAYEVGNVCSYDGKPYKCVQAHDSTGNALWNPVDAPSLWANYHGTDADHALPYVQPTGAHDAYMAGEYAVYNGAVYKCLTDGTVHDPAVLPSAWAVVAE